MTRLSQLIERNRRHSESPYILLLEAVLPSGVTLRFARDPQSWVWPLAGSGHSQFTFPGDSVQYTTTNKITVSIFGRWKGTIGLDALQADGTWKEYTTYLQRIEESHDLPDGTYRLQARTDFRGKAMVWIGDLSLPLWQAMNFDFNNFKSGEGARRGTLTISVSNVSGLPLKYVDELEDWRKKNGRLSAKIRLLVVNTGLLDDPEPTMQLKFVDCGISCPAPMDTVQFILGSRDVYSWQLMRKIMQQYCSWKRLEDCKYVDQCDHTLSTCRDKFNYTINFGGFPMLGKGPLYGS